MHSYTITICPLSKMKLVVRRPEGGECYDEAKVAEDVGLFTPMNHTFTTPMNTVVIRQSNSLQYE